MRQLALAAALLLATPTTAGATSGTVNSGYAGCLTEAALDELQTASAIKDKRQRAALLNKVCFAIGGKKYWPIKFGYMTSLIRVYAGGSSVKLWTVTEAIR
ncbi:MAG: hypothetical protein QF797_05995 [Alphaproteobacteria bacterium]|jgi:hypothetical protein|nr:hypothetical protein [Alphaproteobacteria bacterium]MDP6624234.1 hypothetical protein [Alphaproteobacteria bacterium]|tara:strand:+ start:747 stop:1049 length:303 start_codon:yes stop_codon:yes gene_type:complete